MTFEALETPALLVERRRLDANIARMQTQMARFPHATLRPHLKTVKSIDIAHRLFDGGIGPITVSTLLEAEQFHTAGFRDILYAVGVVAAKLARVAALVRSGARITIITDNVATAQAIADFAVREGLPLPTLIEIDTDGHRSGVTPGDPLLVEIGKLLNEAKCLAGVLTHAGESYAARSHDEIRRYAEMERNGVVAAAEQLREAGLACPTVSAGSTPTALFAEDLDGVTEVRAGVYVLQDLVMAGVTACSTSEIALTVLTTVIGHQQAKGWVIVDAGWMAMSRDRGTANHPVDMGLGLVCDEHGQVLGDLLMTMANQEHGILAGRDGQPLSPDDFPVGRRLRILPNHACATGAQHDRYHLVDGADVLSIWPRFSHW